MSFLLPLSSPAFCPGPISFFFSQIDTFPISFFFIFSILTCISSRRDCDFSTWKDFQQHPRVPSLCGNLLIAQRLSFQMVNTSCIIYMCVFKAFMYCNKLLSFYLSTIRGTEETPKLWGAQVTIEMESPISKVNFYENEEGFADHGHWMEPIWREDGWHFSACISQLRMYFRHDPIFPEEHTDFQKMAPWKKYWTETFQQDQNIWMGKAHDVRMDMDEKGAFARKPHSQLGLGWIQLRQRWIKFCWALLQLPKPSSHGRRGQLQGTWAEMKRAQCPGSLSCVCSKIFLGWAGRALQTLAPNTAQSCPSASTEWKSDPEQGQKIP